MIPARRRRRIGPFPLLVGLLVAGLAGVAHGHVPQGTSAARFFALATPEQTGIVPKALAALLAESDRQGSDALIVLRKGQLVAERHGPRSAPTGARPIELFSITKSLVSLAVGLLMDDGRIGSLETPLSTWYPEWAKDERKARVTLRHVLTHTSGLEHLPAAGQLSRQPDRLAYVRRLPIVTEPGQVFSYNNEACQLLSGIIEQAAGQPADRFLRQRLFEPLGITDWSWSLDAHGHVQTYSGLRLSARDLARIGQLLADGGTVGGRRLISARYLALAMAPASPANPGIGLLFWLEKGGARADGWLGQKMLIYPADRLVVVRLRRQTAGGDEAENRQFGFFGLPALAGRLIAR